MESAFEYIYIVLALHKLIIYLFLFIYTVVPPTDSPAFCSYNGQVSFCMLLTDRS